MRNYKGPPKKTNQDSMESVLFLTWRRCGLILIDLIGLIGSVGYFPRWLLIKLAKGLGLGFIRDNG